MEAPVRLGEGMSARKGWQGTVKIPTSPPTESPNKQDDYVSAHIRVYWPHTATYDQIEEAIDQATGVAMDEAFLVYFPDACRECYRRGGHKMDCSRR